MNAFTKFEIDSAALGTALVDRKALARAVDIAANAAEKRSNPAVLSNLKLSGNGTSLFVSGSNLDIDVTVAIPAAADIHFATTVPADTLKKLVKSAPDCEFVGFTAAETAMGEKNGEAYEECVSPAVIDFEKVNYKLTALPASFFPEISITPSHSFTVSGAAFLDALNSVSDSISQEETRYYLNGIYFHHIDGVLRMVATDGHRLSKQDFEAADGSEGMPGVLIPRKTVLLLEKLMRGKKCPDSVRVDVSDCRIRISFDDVTVTSKVIDGTFPDYHRVMPKHNENKAVFATADLMEAVKAVTVISSERGRAVKMTFTSGNLNLAVNNPDSGSAHTDIACEYDADDLEIGFNAVYVTDLLKIVGDTATMAMHLPGDPAVITGKEGWTGVLMPMRV